jgi:hypothetical protein
VLAVGWLVAAWIAFCLAGEMEQGAVLALAMLLPLGLIWFGDELGDLTGIRAGQVTKRSPGFLIRIFGWLFLLVIIGGTVLSIMAQTPPEG